YQFQNRYLSPDSYQTEPAAHPAYGARPQCPAWQNVPCYVRPSDNYQCDGQTPERVCLWERCASALDGADRRPGYSDPARRSQDRAPAEWFPASEMSVSLPFFYCAALAH